MTRKEHEASKAICEAATKGPWNPDLEFLVGNVPGGRPGGEVIGHFIPSVSDLKTPNRANCAFAAHARTGLPAALEMLERAMGLIKATNYNETPQHPKDICSCGACCRERRAKSLLREWDG